MQHEPHKVELVRAWLKKTEEDLTMAERALQAPEIIGDAVFHCQQSVEKALKAFLAWNDREFSRTHDLLRLVESCRSIDQSFDELRLTAETLTPFSSATRYPDFSAPPSVEEARSMLVEARRAVEFVRQRLPESTHP